MSELAPLNEATTNAQALPAKGSGPVSAERLRAVEHDRGPGVAESGGA